MRRLHALLIAAGLAAASTSALAGPNEPTKDPWTQTFEWSAMATSGPRLGVMVTSLTPELRAHFGAPDDRGVMIARVQPKSAAAAAGLAVGDIVTDVKGTSVDSAADVLAALATAKPGDAVKVSIIRDGKPLTVTATIAEGATSMTPSTWSPSWFQELFRPFWMDRDKDAKTTRT